MKRLLGMVLGVLLTIASLQGPAAAQPDGRDGREGRRAVPANTLYVKQFGDLEQRLADALARHDGAAAQALLSPMFEVRRADAGLVSREAWLQALQAGAAAAPARLSELAVYEAGNHAVANFRSRDASGVEHFVVDVWAPGAEGRWALRVRFESPISSAAGPAKPAKPTKAARPDGKG